MSIEKEPTIDEDRLNELVGTAVNDLGATFHTTLADIGDKLGLYATLAEAGPLNAAATELGRVTKLGGRIAFTSWTPESGLAAMMTVHSEFLPLWPNLPSPSSSGATQTPSATDSATKSRI